MSRTVDWSRFLAEYHAARPGITEDLLAPARDRDGRDPYTWLAEGLATTGPVLDLACGSAPLHAAIGSHWIGLDRSSGELGRAGARGALPLVLGDAGRLPFTDGQFAAVVCSMALMLLEPTDVVLEEVRRVLRSDGALHILLPTLRPLTARDRARFARLYLTFRQAAQLPPTEFRQRPRAALERHGLRIRSDVRRRFAYPLTSTEDADRLVDGLYLPGVPDVRLAAGRALAARWIGSTIGLPLRRMVAVRYP